MSFVFASSHLPEVKRPADEDEEEEDVQPMQRSGMVRAFSHLPPPVRAAPRAAAPPDRPAWAAAPEAPSGHEADDGHDAEPDDDADDGHAPSASTGAHEPDDGSPWYMPRITAADLQPEGGGHDDADSGSAERPPKKWEPEHDPDPGFDGTPPKEWGEPTRDAGFDGTPPKEWGMPTRDAGFDASPLDVHDAPRDATPDTADAAPAPRSAALPYGRLFEKRPTPGFQAPATGRPVLNDLVYRQPAQAASSPPTARPGSLAGIPGGTFQQVAAKTGAQPQVRRANPPAQGGRLGAQPQAPAQAQRPAAGAAQNAPPAPQSLAGQSAEKNPGPNEPGPRITVDAANPHFETAARAALADEAANSPVAAALQKEAGRLGISIVPRRIGMSVTKLENGKLVIYFNPSSKTDTTMSHEIAHAIQSAAFQKVIDAAVKAGKKVDGDVIKRATQAGRDALDKIIPVQSNKDQGQDYKENDAMRVAHVVGAERTATEMKNLPEEQKTLAEFLRRQAEKEKARGEPEKGRKHPNNNYPLPPGTERGNYDYQYVRDVLGLDEKGNKKPRPLSPVRPPPPPQNPQQQPLPPPQPLG